MKLIKSKARVGKPMAILKIVPSASYDRNSESTRVSVTLYVESFETEIHPLRYTLTMSAEEARALGSDLTRKAEFKGHD